MFEMSNESAEGIDQSTGFAFMERRRQHPRPLAIGRFLLFALVMGIALWSIRFVLMRNPATASLLKAADSGDLDPVLIWIVDSGALAIVLLYVAIAGRYQKKSLTDYGLPLRAAFGKQWAAGLMLGFVLAALDICITWSLGGYSFGSLAVSPTDLLRNAILWGGAFILVGIYEEFLYRGYALHTLTEAIGFWPAAMFLATIFGVLHLLNPGEGAIGALDVIAYALFASFTLRRSGTLWFAIGVHSAWDFSLTFIFSAPGSGLTARGSLLHSSLHGAAWLTGGSAGPEGSVIGLLVLAAAFVACYRFLPQGN